MVTVAPPAGVPYEDALFRLPRGAVDLVEQPGEIVAVASVDPSAVASVPFAQYAWLVEERPQWDGFRGPARVVPGVKQMTFLYRADGMDHDEFARHWTEDHTELARRHHPALWRYRQNVVLERIIPGSPDIDGIAELGMRLRLDFRERMYDSDDGRRAVAEDVRRFLDLDRSWQLITREYPIEKGTDING